MSIEIFLDKFTAGASIALGIFAVICVVALIMWLISVARELSELREADHRFQRELYAIERDIQDVKKAISFNKS